MTLLGTEFPGTATRVPGARLQQIIDTVFLTNPLRREEGPGTDSMVIDTPSDLGLSSGFNPCGARHYLSRAEGSGYWDMLYIMDGLLLSIADAQYRQPVDTHWPDDKVLKIRIALSGTLRERDGTLICGPGDCVLHSFSGLRGRPYVVDAVAEPYQSVCLHVNQPMLRFMEFPTDSLGEPFRSLLEQDTLPDTLWPLKASHTLIGLARDMVQSRDMFNADTRRFYLAARALEIVLTVIEQSRPKTVPNTGANRVSQRDVARIQEARRILESSFVAPPTIQELARLVGINTTKLKLGFRELFGATIQSFIVSLRMQTGLTLIENTDLSISEIAYRVGYAHPASFTQAMRKHFGQTPQALRNASPGSH